MQALESLGPVAHDTAILVQEDPGNAGLNWRVLAISTSFGHGKTDCGSCVKFTEIFFVKLQVVLLGFHSRRGFGDLF